MQIAHSTRISADKTAGTDLLAIARTDSEAATLITSTIDHRDHAFIVGSTNPNLQPLNDLMLAGEQAGKTGEELQAIEDQWIAQAGLKLFDDAVVDTIKAGVHVNKDALIKEYLTAAKGKSNSEARAIAKGITGVDIYWDWDAPRTREGYYRYQGGTQCAINRAVAYAPFADLISRDSALWAMPGSSSPWLVYTLPRSSPTSSPGPTRNRECARTVNWCRNPRWSRVWTW